MADDSLSASENNSVILHTPFILLSVTASVVCIENVTHTLQHLITESLLSLPCCQKQLTVRRTMRPCLYRHSAC